MLRFQQFIELVRTTDIEKIKEALSHAIEHLYPFRELYEKEVSQACGLLVFPPGTRGNPYAVSSFARH